MVLKEASYYKKLNLKSVQCVLCPRFCVILDGQRGDCLARVNDNGKLFSVVYSKICSAGVDPVEKKPLYHFLPGSKLYSIGTAGCNLHCKFCQNWTIAQTLPENVESVFMEPKNVVDFALKSKCLGIAYTYNEPTVFSEFVYDTSKLAKKNGLKNVMVTNGYINPEVVEDLYPLIDAVNIDLKGFSEDFYKTVTGSKLKPVLDAIKLIKKQGTFIEITNLLIPGINDDLKLIKKMCTWIVEHLGNETPLHFSRFFPDYKFQDILPTKPETLFAARKIALESGIKYVYLGNLDVVDESNTFCPNCKKLLIKRNVFGKLENNLKNGTCDCGQKISGVWK